jgi:hypothetical protein
MVSGRKLPKTSPPDVATKPSLRREARVVAICCYYGCLALFNLVPVPTDCFNPPVVILSGCLIEASVLFVYTYLAENKADFAMTTLMSQRSLKTVIATRGTSGSNLMDLAEALVIVIQNIILI